MQPKDEDADAGQVTQRRCSCSRSLPGGVCGRLDQWQRTYFVHSSCPCQAQPRPCIQVVPNKCQAGIEPVL